MPIEPINTVALQQFLQQVKQAEASRAKEIRLDITQAKNLAFTLGEVMARMNGDLERFVEEQIQKLQNEQVISIEMGGTGDWK